MRAPQRRRRPSAHHSPPFSHLTLSFDPLAV